jgi:hypothetical protein
VGQAVYAIDAFPDDDLLWRIEWIGGVGYNTSVPSEPQMHVCLAQLPKGEKNPLSARARSSQVEKRTVKIGVGLLAEIIRFYYGPSTRLAQALFWGEYHNMFNADRSGVFKEGVVRVHLRRWLEDEDSWTLARYICSPLMQSEVS